MVPKEVGHPKGLGEEADVPTRPEVADDARPASTDPQTPGPAHDLFGHLLS